MGCSCNASSGYSGGGCGNSGCGCGCNKCRACPPCENALPETCEPLEVTTTAARLVVEDEASCKRTIQTPDAPQILGVNADGEIDWLDGSEENPVCLPELQEQTEGEAPGVLTQTEEGCLIRLTPLTGGGEPTLQLLYGNNTGDTYYGDVADIVQTCGLIYKDCDDDTLKTLTGTTGQFVTFDVDGNPTVAAVQASGQSTVGLFISCDVTGATTTINALSISLTNGSSWLTFQNVAANLTLSGTGANSLDTGTAATGTLYWLYLIYNPTTATMASLASLSAVLPLLPADYTYYRKVGALVSKSSVATEAIYFHQSMECWKAAQIGNTYPNTVIPNDSGLTASSPSFTAGISGQYVKKWTGQIQVDRDNADTGNIKFTVSHAGQNFTVPSFVVGATTGSVYEPIFEFEAISSFSSSTIIIAAAGTFGGNTEWSYALNGAEWNFI